MRNPERKGAELRMRFEPHFQVRRESAWINFLGSLAEFVRRTPHLKNGSYDRFTRDLVGARAPQTKKALLASFLLHLAVGLFWINMPYGFFSFHEALPNHRAAVTPLTYRLTPVDLSRVLPNLRPPGPGGRPGRGDRPDRVPVLGSSAFHPKITIVSNFPHPDNRRQTIIQPNAPPDLRIAQDLHLPNLLTGNLDPKLKRPMELKLTAPRAANRETPQDVKAPELAATPRDVDIPLAAATVDVPKLPVPQASMLAAPTRSSGSANTSGVANQGSSDSASSGLMILGTDPAPAGTPIVLSSGNRYGEFTISPGGGQPGSPGGVPGGDPGGGTGGPGPGGDGSSAVGNGNSGGGGGGSGAGGLPVSITGTLGSTGGLSGPFLSSGAPAMSMVVPLTTPPSMRKPALLFFTGPVGGGGLNVYGVLRCGKIYTVYLPMPGKKWVLEYCALGSVAPKDPVTNGAITIQPDLGLVAPAIDERYDFRRPAVPTEKAGKMIVLHGSIQEDGTIGALAVYQGVAPDADLAARAAFSRWKFKPALREGKPIRVEILVGIPATVPENNN
jgi:hypothetical protein